MQMRRRQADGQRRRLRGGVGDADAEGFAIRQRTVQQRLGAQRLLQRHGKAQRPGTGPLGFAVALEEPLGSEALLHGTLPDGEAFRIRVPYPAPQATALTISLPAAHLHLFDAQTGKRLEIA